MFYSLLFRVSTCLAALALGAGRASAVDGVLLSVRYESDKMGNIHDSSQPGKLMRYDIKADKVSSKALIDTPTVNNACIGPAGDRVAVTRADGVLALVGIDGGAQTELLRYVGDEKPKPGTPFATGVQWPASEGGKWVYYMDGRNGGADNTLRRVHIDTKKDEKVVRFNRSAAGGFALTPDATPRSGKYVKRTDNYVIAIYDMAKGDGDLYNCPRSGGCGESASPDGSLFTANDGSHTKVSLVDMAGRGTGGFRLSEWDGDPTNGLPREKVEWAWQHFRWSVNAMNWIAVTQGKLKRGSTHEIYFADAMLYDWAGKKQLNVTRNEHGAFDRALGFWEAGSRRAFLGYFSGKAPLTVEIADRRVSREAEWNLGDGTKVKGGTIRHTYKKEGSYSVEARDGERVYQAQVNVQKRRPPSAVAHYVNEKCLLVEFNETVRSPKLDVKLASGARVARAELNGTGRRLLVLLAEPLRRDDGLRLEGVTDLAQEPNALPGTPLRVTVPVWPTNRADLVFLWENAKALNAVHDAGAKEVRELRVSRDAGQAGTDRYGRMRLEKGRLATGFYSQVNAQMQFRDLVLADAFTLELTLQAKDLTQSRPAYPTRIVNCGAWYDADWEFLLGQQKDKLMFSIRTTDNMLSADGKRIKNDLHGKAPLYAIARLPDTMPHHLIVSYTTGRLTAYLDGKKVFETKEVTGSLKAWGYGELCFGDNHNGGRHQWAGRLEGVAIYKRFVEEAEAARNHAAFRERLKSRKVMPQLEVQVKLLASSKIPDPRQIAPYRDALVVNEFEVEKVVNVPKGWAFDPAIKPGQKIRVAQWGLVDGLPTGLARAKVGGSHRLLLEVFAGHPEKVDELEISTSLAEDFEVPLLYEPMP